MSNRHRFTPLFSAPSRKTQKTRKKWRLRYIIWSAIKRTCMLIGAFVLFGSLMGAIISGLAMKDVAAPLLPDEMVLYLPIESVVLEHKDQLGPYDFSDKSLTIRGIVSALDHAIEDERVKGFIAKLKGGALNIAQMQELHDAVLRFRESGKFAYIYSTSYDSIGAYYIASAFEEIWLQPAGVLSISGLNVEVPYARELLDYIGVEPQVFARKEYKNLFESATDKEMSQESREALRQLVADLRNEMVADISTAREMDQSNFQALVDKGLIMDFEAIESGLIDVLDYNDRFNEVVKELVTGDPKNKDKIFAPVTRYLKETAADRNNSLGSQKKPKVALIYAVGAITQYDDGGGNLSAENIVSVIDEAAENEDIEVIVIRVDSPGGAPTAAETIRRAILKAKDNDKMVIISMGASAASGGYWIAANADYIFALPMTFTGSIGVTGGKFSLEQMWENIGVNWDGEQWGQNASLWSFNQPYTETESARMNLLMDDVYERFVKIVAEGRGLDVETVDAISGGRVWTGISAKQVGLVDELGGLDAALDYAAGLVGVNSRADLQIVVLPRPKTTFERVIQLLEAQASIGTFAQENKKALSVFTEFMNKLNAAAKGYVQIDTYR